MRSLLRDISLRDLRARPYRVATFVLAIALGVALVTAVQVSTDSVVRHFNAQLAKVAGRADLQITFGTGEAGFPEEIIHTVKRQPYVRSAVAVVRGAVQFADTGEVLELFGIDVLDEDVQSFYSVTVTARTADEFSILNDPYGIFLPKKIATDRSLAIGDRVDLMTLSGLHAFTVHGIFTGTGLAQAYDGRVAVMYLPAAQGVLAAYRDTNTSNIDQIDVVLQRDSTRAAATTSLRGVLPESLAVAEPEQRQLANERLVAGLRATLLGISVFALLAAMFIVYSTSAALVIYRIPVLGTLVIAGASPRSLFHLVIAESAILGLAGGAIGALLGVLMARFAMHDAAVGLSLNYSLDFVPMGQALPGRMGLALFPLLGSLAAILSSYVPARRLRTLDPLELQRVGLVDAFSRHSYLRVAVIASAVAGGSLYALERGVRDGSAVLCATGTTLLAVTVLLLCLPLVRVSWAGLCPLVRRFGDTASWLAIEQLNRNLERSLVTVAAIALSIAVVLAAATLPRCFRVSVKHWYGFYGDAVVVSRAHQSGWLKAPLADAYAATLEAMPGVARVETFRVLQGQPYRGSRIAIAALSTGYIKRALEGAGIDRESDHADVLRAMEHGDAAAISENLAVHYGLSVGDRIELEAPLAVVALPVVAIVPDFISDRGSVLLGRDLVRQYWRDSLVNYFAVFLEPHTSVGSFRDGLVGSLGKEGQILSVLSMGALVAEIDGAIAAAFADIDALQLLVIVITVAGIVDLVVSNVLDRRRLHAAFRIVGATDAGILKIIGVEGGLIGVSAGLVGIVVGVLASWTWIHFTYPVLVGYVLRLHIAWTNAVVCVALATAIAVAAGTIAGRVRLGESPVDAIRAE